MELAVTTEAANYIGERGGRLYLWQEAVGKDWATDHMGFIEPSREVLFTAFWAGGVGVMLAEDLELPERLRLRLHGFLHRRLHVEWDGERWGRRGGDSGAPG